VPEKATPCTPSQATAPHPFSRSLLPHWQRDVFQVNACPATTNTSACAHVHSGALQRGLVVGMEALAMVVTETLASRGLANQDVSVVEVGLPFVVVCGLPEQHTRCCVFPGRASCVDGRR
jgi:hypothetical protein